MHDVRGDTDRCYLCGSNEERITCSDRGANFCPRCHRPASLVAGGQGKDNEQFEAESGAFFGLALVGIAWLLLTLGVLLIHAIS